MNEGSLKDLSGKSVPFKPIEISKRIMVIVTTQSLAANDTLILTIEAEALMLQVKAQRLLPGRDSEYLTELISVDNKQSLEQSLPRLNEFKISPIKQSSSNPATPATPEPVAVRSVRFVPNTTLKVSAKTFGTRTVYAMYAMNVSKSGMLLASTEKDIVPFAVNSLLELVVHPDSGFLEKEIRCSAKVVRMDHAHLATSIYGDRVTSAFGVQFSELDAEWLPAWRVYVETVEEENAKLI